MESAIQTMVKVFMKSTKGKESLGQTQFQSLVKSQLSNILSDSKEAVKNMGQGLDANHDGKVGFEEYLKLVGYLAVSLSEQRDVAKEEPAQNAASEPVAQTGPDKEEAKPEANAEAKGEAKPEANAEAKEEAKPEANNDAKVDAVAEVKVDENVGVTVEMKPEGETKPEAAKEGEEKAMAAAAVMEEAAAGVAVFVKQEGEKAEIEKVEKVEKVEEAVEKVAAEVEEEVEKKIEEATS